MSFFSLLLTAVIIIIAIAVVLNVKNLEKVFADIFNIKFPSFPSGDVDLERFNPFKKSPEQKAVENLEQTAKDEGFVKSNGLSALEQSNLQKDAGSVVVGSGNQEVNFGLIGDKLPSDPSEFFIANKEKLLTPEQLEKFNEQLSTTATTTGKRKRFGV